MSPRPHARTQRGAAILVAMLLVALVAALSATALWRQWRGVEVEAAERARVQSGWLLQGALDWARLILREDARAGSTDHLAEPWAVPLQEARLSAFLASAQGHSDTTDTLQAAFLSGRIVDQQARLNVTNLVQDGRPHAPSVRAFTRLFAALHLPDAERVTLIQNLQRALQPPAPAGAPGAADIPLLPRSTDQLTWLGLSPASLAALQPYITLLPERTPVNLNTAPALVLHACISGLDMAGAQGLITARAQSHFRTLGDATRAMGAADTALDEGEHSVNSRYFEVRGQLRLDDRVVQERSVLQRDGLVVRVLWRERGAQAPIASVQ